MKRRILALLAIASLVALVVLFRVPYNAHWAAVITDSGHGPVSALIAAIAFSVLHGRLARRPLLLHALLAVVFTTAIGILIELVQSQVGRDAEVMDVVRDLYGAIAGAGLCLFFTARPDSPGLRWTSLAAAAVATSLIIAPVVVMAAAYAERSQRFPLLMDGNSLLGDTFVNAFDFTPKRETLPAAASPELPGQKALRIREVGHGWAIAVTEVQPDWRAWDALVVDLFNASAFELPLQLRVYDRSDGLANDIGFITSIRLPPQARTQWRLPLQDMATASGSQRIDLSHVQGAIMYTGMRRPDVYLLNMRLER